MDRQSRVSLIIEETDSVFNSANLFGGPVKMRPVDETSSKLDQRIIEKLGDFELVKHIFLRDHRKPCAIQRPIHRPITNPLPNASHLIQSKPKSSKDYEIADWAKSKVPLINQYTQLMLENPKKHQTIKQDTQSLSEKPKIHQPMKQYTQSLSEKPKIHQPMKQCTQSLSEKRKIHQPMNQCTQSLSEKPKIHQPMKQYTQSLSEKADKHQPIKNSVESMKQKSSYQPRSQSRKKENKEMSLLDDILGEMTKSNPFPKSLNKTLKQHPLQHDSLRYANGGMVRTHQRPTPYDRR